MFPPHRTAHRTHARAIAKASVSVRYPATDLDNRPIKVPAFSQREREEEVRQRKRAREREVGGRRAAEKLTNVERKLKRRQKNQAAIEHKRSKAPPKAGKAKAKAKATVERKKRPAPTGNFKSKKRYKRR